MTIKDIIEKGIVYKMKDDNKACCNDSITARSNLFPISRLYKQCIEYGKEENYWIEAVNEEDYLEYRKEAYGY